MFSLASSNIAQTQRRALAPLLFALGPMLETFSELEEGDASHYAPALHLGLTEWRRIKEAFQGRGSSDRQSHRTTPLVKIIGAAAIALLASANTFANAAENSTKMAREHHACAVVMGLYQPGDLYDTCIRSLDRSLSEWDQARLIDSDRSACAQSGLEPGTPAFAVCVVNVGKSLGNAGHNQPIVPAH